MELFLAAAVLKLRFDSAVGQLTTEQLFDMPLTSKTPGKSLDDIAKSINAELKQASEESFVATSHNPAKTALQNKLDVVKAVILHKQEEAARRASANQRAEQRQFLLDLLDRKRTDELSNLSAEEIQARLNALGTE